MAFGFQNVFKLTYITFHADINFRKKKLDNKVHVILDRYEKFNKNIVKAVFEKKK